MTTNLTDERLAEMLAEVNSMLNEEARLFAADTYREMVAAAPSHPITLTQEPNNGQ